MRKQEKPPWSWPGILFSAAGLVVSAKALFDLGAAAGIGGELYPEYFLIPAFLCWPIFVFQYARFVNERSTEKFDQVRMMLWALLAGPLGFWLAGPCLSTVAHVLASAVTEFSAQSADLDRLVNSFGVFVLIGLVLLIYVGTAAAIAVSTWKIVGKSCRIAARNSGRQFDGSLYKLLVALSLTAPGFWMVLNTHGTYRGFVFFLLAQCLGFIIAFGCFRQIVKLTLPDQPEAQDAAATHALREQPQPGSPIKLEGRQEDPGVVINTKRDQAGPLLQTERSKADGESS